MTPLCFLDCETTSLARPFSPTPGEIWEVGLILRDQDGEAEYRWLLPVTLEHANPKSLDIGGFHDRHPQGDRWAGPGPDDLVLDLAAFCADFAALTDGAHLVGNVVSFDEERLAALLMAHGVQPTWHYHLIDSESMAAGYLAGMATVVTEYGIPHDDDHRRLPGEEPCYGAKVMAAAKHAQPRWDSEALSAAIGVVPPGPDLRHTALGDAIWVEATWDQVMGGR